MMGNIIFSITHLLLLLPLLLPLLFQFHHVEAQQTGKLLLNSSLAGDSKLLSPNGTFSLGLISLVPHKWYLGISYTELDKKNIWIANRNQSVGDGASLNLTADGNLVLQDSNQDIVWTSNTGNMRVTHAELMDSGNLVLMNSSNEIVWESFEHPSDTWMPGMKMSLGKKLVSWRSSLDPTPGRFLMKLLPDSQYVSLWNESIQYWSSGVWNGNIFTNVPMMTLNFIYTFTFVNTSSTDKYFTWTEKYGNSSSHFTLGVNGVILVTILQRSQGSPQWYNIFTQPDNVCAVEHLCGPYGICNKDTSTCSCPSGFQPATPADWNASDWSAGCVPILKQNCSTAASFLSMQSISYNSRGSSSNNSSTSYTGRDLKSCEKLCAEDCSCTGYSFGQQGNDLCSIQHGPLVNGIKSSDTRGAFFLRVAELPSSPRPHRRSSKRALSIGVGCASAVLVLAVVALFVIRWVRRTPRDISDVLTAFSYRELQKATKNFSHKLGQGGFGAVFKGLLPDNTPVAVKRLDNMKQGEKEFHAEVRTLGTIQHINLVRLRGFCAEGSHKLLVYEYMTKGSLDKQLFLKDGNANEHLDWKTRYGIALGTARALAYLHDECRDRIIHCDIKPENILLDADFCAKVSDFGLAKLLGRDISRAITNMRGTRGYLAPEWISNLPITPKADVYSYGMTLLEIIGGRRNVDVNADIEMWYFPMWAFQQTKAGNIASVVDKRLQGDVELDQVERAVKVAISCIQDDEASRPSMNVVVQMLEGNVDVPKPILPNSFKLLDVGNGDQISSLVASNHINRSVMFDDVRPDNNGIIDGR